MRFVMTSRERVVYLMYVYRRRASDFIVFSLASLKRYCAHIFEVPSCVLIVIINAFVNVEACSFIVILYREVNATQIIDFRLLAKASRFLYHQYVVFLYLLFLQ